LPSWENSAFGSNDFFPQEEELGRSPFVGPNTRSFHACSSIDRVPKAQEVYNSRRVPIKSKEILEAK